MEEVRVGKPAARTKKVAGDNNCVDSSSSQHSLHSHSPWQIYRRSPARAPMKQEPEQRDAPAGTSGREVANPLEGSAQLEAYQKAVLEAQTAALRRIKRGFLPDGAHFHTATQPLQASLFLLVAHSCCNEHSARAMQVNCVATHTARADCLLKACFLLAANQPAF